MKVSSTRSQLCSGLMIWAESKCKVPIVRVPQGRGACGAEGSRDVVEKAQGKRKEPGSLQTCISWCFLVLKKQFCLAKRSDL